MAKKRMRGGYAWGGQVESAIGSSELKEISILSEGRWPCNKKKGNNEKTRGNENGKWTEDRVIFLISCLPSRELW